MVGKDGSGFDIAEYGVGQNKGDGAEEELFEMFHRVFVERGDAARGGPLFVRLVFRPSVLRRQYLGGRYRVHRVFERSDRFAVDEEEVFVAVDLAF